MFVNDFKLESIHLFVRVREGDGRDELRVSHLLLGNRYDLFPHRNQPVGRGREVVSDGLMQRGQVVAGHGGVHVVLDMEIHVPIPTPHDRVVQIETAADESEVVHHIGLVLAAEVAMVHANVLGGGGGESVSVNVNARVTDGVRVAC